MYPHKVILYPKLCLLSIKNPSPVDLKGGYKKNVSICDKVTFQVYRGEVFDTQKIDFT